MQIKGSKYTIFGTHHNVKVKVKVKGAEVVSIMNNMSQSCLLLWC